MSKTVQLHIEMKKDTYQVGDEIAVQVRNENGNPVEDVTVQTPTGTAGKTDKTGNINITFRQTGTFVLQAHKSNIQSINYITGSKNVKVTRKTIELYIETDKDTYQVGDEIAVQVRNEIGNPVEDVTIQAPNGIATTDTNGETALPIQQTGIIELEAHKEDTEKIAYIAEQLSVRGKSQ